MSLEIIIRAAGVDVSASLRDDVLPILLQLVQDFREGSDVPLLLTPDASTGTAGPEHCC